MGNENIKTFNDDDEGPVTKVEIDCLKKKSSDSKEWTLTMRAKKDI